MERNMKKLPIIFSIAIVMVLGFSISGASGLIPVSEPTIPEWIKNSAKWWSEGSISESDYIKSLQYLIGTGVIDVPIPITEVTAAETMYSPEESAKSFRVTISNIVEPIPVHYFQKFQLLAHSEDDELMRLYDFRDTNPEFFLESLPTADKKPFYDFIADWMDRGDTLNEFDVDVTVLDGTGGEIQTWAFEKCEISSYGTFVQDTVFYWQYSGLQEPEIRDRTVFSCTGIHLETP